MRTAKTMLAAAVLAASCAAVNAGDGKIPGISSLWEWSSAYKAVNCGGRTLRAVLVSNGLTGPELLVKGARIEDSKSGYPQRTLVEEITISAAPEKKRPLSGRKNKKRAGSPVARKAERVLIKIRKTHLTDLNDEKFNYLPVDTVTIIYIVSRAGKKEAVEISRVDCSTTRELYNPEEEETGPGEKIGAAL